MTSPEEKLQRHTFEKVGGGYQFTTTTDGLWVMAKDVEQLKRLLAKTTDRLEVCGKMLNGVADVRDKLKRELAMEHLKRIDAEAAFHKASGELAGRDLIAAQSATQRTVARRRRHDA